MTTTPVQIRTIRGETWMNAGHLTARLREIAEENRQAAYAYGDPYPDDQHDAVVAFHAAALRFEETADYIDLAIIGYLTEHPGDSNLGVSHGGDLET